MACSRDDTYSIGGHAPISSPDAVVPGSAMTLPPSPWSLALSARPDASCLNSSPVLALNGHAVFDRGLGHTPSRIADALGEYMFYISSRGQS